MCRPRLLSQQYICKHALMSSMKHQMVNQGLWGTTRTKGRRGAGGWEEGKRGGATILGLTHSHCVLPMSPVSSVPAADASCEGTSITYHCRMPACVDVMHRMLSFGASQIRKLTEQATLVANAIDSEY